MTPERRDCRHGSVRLELIAWPAPAGRGLPVLLVPGMAAAAASWVAREGLVGDLRAGGERAVIAVSLRGRGGSDCPAEGWAAADQQGDLLAALDAEGVERCHVIGHSVGGSYALGLALDAPKRVASVVAGDFPPVVPAYGAAWVRRLRSWGSDASFHRDFPRLVAAGQQRVDLAPRLGELRAPLLVLKGTREGSLLPDTALAAYAGAPGLSVVRVDADHDVFAAPAAGRACAAFLRQVETREG